MKEGRRVILEEGKGLLAYATEYIRQIRAADDDVALILMKEFGSIAYQMGWNAALDRAAELKVK